MSKEVQVEWLGERRPKIVELPIPLRSKSEKTGEVVCDPIGLFSKEDAAKLIQTPSLWRLVYGTDKRSKDYGTRYTDEGGPPRYPGRPKKGSSPAQQEDPRRQEWQEK